MSRIHEALKKAASERKAHFNEGSASELVELVGEKSIAAELTEARQAEHGKVDPTFAVPLSAGFEELRRRCVRTEWKFDPRFNIFASNSVNPSGAEKFRTLRSRLYQIAATRPLKRLLVTSSVPQEGKTFIASNLAQSIIRQEGRRVLLIDGDLRASRIHLTLGAPPMPGLSDYLRGEIPEYNFVQVGQEANLCLIPGGSAVSNPSELLHSMTMKSLLDQMSPLFDWVIVDSPPAIAVHDASILADMCDGVLFVVRAGETDFELVQRAIGEFQAEKLLGVVLNRAEKNDGYPDYYYAYSKDKD